MKKQTSVVISGVEGEVDHKEVIKLFCMVLWWAYSTQQFCQNIWNWKAQEVNFISCKVKKKEMKMKKNNLGFKGQKIKCYYKN